MNKKLIYFCSIVGMTLGSLVPGLWGGDLLGGVSILLGLVGGIVGVWLGVVVSKRLG